MKNATKELDLIPAFFKLKRPSLNLFLLLAALLVGTTFTSLFAQTFPAGFSQVQVASGISNPTVLAFAPDGRIFVAEQGGKLLIIKNGALLPTPFLQLSVDASGERGLIGIALDPNFATNNYIYLYYTVPTGTIHNRVSRFTANGDVALAGSEKIILELDFLSNATNHNGGAMQFSQDGKLYLAVGENANRAHAQNLDTYHGKILRINPDGSVPTGNPYTTGSEQRKRVWSYGLRNPYTIDFQPGTGRLFVNDVGEVTWEEINDATMGGLNFGWPGAEGISSNTAYKNPFYTYQHGSGDNHGCAITGGVFFNPVTSNYPASYTGKYFYQDLCNNWINFIDVSGSTAVRSAFATGLPGQSLSLSLGTDGNLYYLSRSNRALYKIIYTNNTAPAITSQPSNVTVSQGQPATFQVSASGTAPLSYQWQKNGVNIAGATGATYTMASTMATSAGQYRVIVTNLAGSVTSNPATLTITTFNAAPTAKITSPANHTIYRAGTSISFTGTGTDPEDGTLPASAFTWTVVFHHDAHKHDGPPVTSGAKSGSFTIPNQGEIATNVWYRLILTVTDSKGLMHRDTIDLNPRVVTVNLATNPPGLQLTLNNQSKTTPFAQNFVAGMIIPLSAPSPQNINGITYQFSHWSSGIVSGGNITVPDVNSTYIANFSAGETTFLSDLAWLSASNGYGPVEKDKSNWGANAGDGKVITLNGVTYTKGLGVHATSTLLYNLAGKYSQFISDVGIDDEVGNNGLVNFQVYLDNVLTFESGNMSGSSATKSINLNVSGKSQLKLVVTDGGNGFNYDHADWAGARLMVNALQTSTDFPIVKNSVWKYHDKGQNLGLGWTTLTYDDAAWSAGAGVLGYGDPVATTMSYGSTSKYPSYYFRKSFEVTDASLYSTLVFSIRRDDGAVVYLNGVEQFRTNMPTGAVSYNTFASSALSGTSETTYYTFRVPTSQLRSGRNVIAVSLHQYNISSSDIIFDMEVRGETITSASLPSAFSATAEPDNYTGARKIFQINPNPFRHKTTIAFSFDEEQEYKVMVYDVRGSLVKALASGKAKANTLVKVNWAEEKIPAGVYFVRLVTKHGIQTLQVMRE